MKNNPSNPGLVIVVGIPLLIALLALCIAYPWLMAGSVGGTTVFILALVLWFWKRTRASKRPETPEAELKRKQKQGPKLARRRMRALKVLHVERDELWALKNAWLRLNDFPTAWGFFSQLEDRLHRSWTEVRRDKKALRARFSLHRGPAWWRNSPLAAWMGRWVRWKENPIRICDHLLSGRRCYRHVLRTGVKGWSAEEDYETVCKLQRIEWEVRYQKHLARARALQEEVDELGKELDGKQKNLLADLPKSLLDMESMRADTSGVVRMRSPLEEDLARLAELRAVAARKGEEARQAVRVADDFEAEVNAKLPGDGPHRKAGICTK